MIMIIIMIIIIINFLLRIIPLYSGSPSTQNNLLRPEIPIHTIFFTQSLPLHGSAYSIHPAFSRSAFFLFFLLSNSISSMVFCSQAPVLNVHSNLKRFSCIISKIFLLICILCLITVFPILSFLDILADLLLKSISAANCVLSRHCPYSCPIQ